MNVVTAGRAFGVVANNVRFAHGVLLAEHIKVTTQGLGVSEVGSVSLHDGGVLVLEPQALASGLIGDLIRPTIAVAGYMELVVVGCELHGHGSLFHKIPNIVRRVGDC